MWTKIKSQQDINKMKLNSRLLKFTGTGIPMDPPISDPAYTTFSLQKNTGGNLDLKISGHNPLFIPSLIQGTTDLLHKTAAQLIDEGIWWF